MSFPRMKCRPTLAIQLLLITNSAARGSGGKPVVAAPRSPDPATDASVSTNLATLASRYEQGLVSKGEVIQAILMEGNRKSLDLYGLVIDQYGQPVAGAKVKGSIGLNVSMVQSGGAFHYTTTAMGISS